MSHEHFNLRRASPEVLDLVVIGGGAGLLVMVSLIGFLIWRDKRRGLGKPKPARNVRARKPRRLAQLTPGTPNAPCIRRDLSVTPTVGMAAPRGRRPRTPMEIK